MDMELDEGRHGFGKMGFGCKHYRRRCRIRAPCCNDVFHCRHCHNESTVCSLLLLLLCSLLPALLARLKPPLPLTFLSISAFHLHTVLGLGSRKTGTSSTATQFHRSYVSSVTPSSRWRRCAPTAASAWGSTSAGRANSSTTMLTRSNTTAKTAASAAELTETVVHFNRVGGKDNFFHCQKCGSCYSVTLRDKHPCIEDSMKNNCPICYEYLFDSLRETSVLRCGHTMHLQCFHEMLKHDKFTCPMCSMSIFDMEKFLRALDAEIESNLLHTGCMGKGWIVCNDCRDTTRVYPGMAGQRKCCHCQSYNTCRVAPPVLPA